MNSFKRSVGMLGCSVALAFSVTGAASAADLGTMALPAVSGPNAKIELSAGYVDMNGFDDSALLKGGASLSFPVGDMFGIQADIAAIDALHDTAGGGALHFFTRDPSQYLLGVLGGYSNLNNANVWYVGPEAELYFDQVSVEATAGYMNLDPHGGSSKNKFYAIGDLALYATDNLRLSIGGSSVAGFNSARGGLEWYMGDMGLPASFTLVGRLGEHGYKAISAGFSIYLGGEEKSLIRRHREDDPRNRALDIYYAVPDAAPPPPPPEETPPPPPEVPPPVEVVID